MPRERPPASIKMPRTKSPSMAELSWTFTFQKLSRMDDAKKVQEQSKDGVKVRLVKLIPDDDPWDVGLQLVYPKGGPAFESFQSWLVNNDIYLENVRTHRQVRPPAAGK